MDPGDIFANYWPGFAALILAWLGYVTGSPSKGARVLFLVLAISALIGTFYGQYSQNVERLRQRDLNHDEKERQEAHDRARDAESAVTQGQLDRMYSTLLALAEKQLATEKQSQRDKARAVPSSPQPRRTPTRNLGSPVEMSSTNTTPHPTIDRDALKVRALDLRVRILSMMKEFFDGPFSKLALKSPEYVKAFDQLKARYRKEFYPQALALFDEMAEAAPGDRAFILDIKESQVLAPIEEPMDIVDVGEWAASIGSNLDNPP